jgi:hypothetical protein
MAATFDQLYPDLKRENAASAGLVTGDGAVIPDPHARDEKNPKPYGIQFIEATVSAFTRWDRWVMFASLFFVACE